MVLENFLIDADIHWDRAGKELYEKPEARTGRIMRVQVTNRGVVEDLTGFTLNLGWKSTIDETKFGLDAFDAVDATKGIFEIEYTSGMLTNIGTLKGALQLVPTVGNTVESNNFAITVTRSAVDAAGVQTESSFSTLTTALVQVNAWNATIGGKVIDWEADMAATKQTYIDTMNDVEATYPQELISLGSQLADNANALSKTKLSIFGGLFAHRGLQARGPENTLNAVAEAGRLGFAGVEIDTAKTSDGYWVVMHDATVDRTTDGTGTVSAMTLAQIQALKIDTPTSLIDTDEIIRVPLFEDVLKECAYWGLGVNVDGSKFTINQTNVEYIVGMLDKYNLTHKSFIACPTVANRQTVRQYAPELKVAWVSFAADVDADIAEAALYGNNAIVAYSSEALPDDVIEKCNKAGVDVYAIGANTVYLVYKYLNKGVKYIETDIILPGGTF